jgi:outer membrane biosynthesis protein TonB
MEINIKVAIELPDWAEALVKTIANNIVNGKVQVNQPEKPADEAPAQQPAKPAAPAAKPAAPAPKPAAKPAAPAPKPKPAAPAAPKPAAKPAEQETTEEAEEESVHTLEELRDLLKSKVEGNGATIKAKLAEFNAVSLSKLDPEYYDAMYAFLDTL